MSDVPFSFVCQIVLSHDGFELAMQGAHENHPLISAAESGMAQRVKKPASALQLQEIELEKRMRQLALIEQNCVKTETANNYTRDFCAQTRKLERFRQCCHTPCKNKIPEALADGLTSTILSRKQTSIAILMTAITGFTCSQACTDAFQADLQTFLGRHAAPHTELMCANCKVASYTKEFKSCSCCTEMRYCDAKCEEAHAPVHKGTTTKQK